MQPVERRRVMRPQPLPYVPTSEPASATPLTDAYEDYRGMVARLTVAMRDEQAAPLGSLAKRLAEAQVVRLERDAMEPWLVLNDAGIDPDMMDAREIVWRADVTLNPALRSLCRDCRRDVSAYGGRCPKHDVED